MVKPLERVSAVIMAGGPTKESLYLKARNKWYEKREDKEYLEGKYKPLELMKIDHTERFLLDISIEKVSKAERIEDIVVVGEKERIEKALGKIDYGKKVTIIQQSGGFVENGQIAYPFTKAALTNDSAFFVASDIPRATPEDYDDFVEKCLSKGEEYGFVFAIIGKENLEKNERFKRKKGRRYKSRKCFWFMDDISANNQLRGFRLANMGFGNPNKITNLPKINTLYGMRRQTNLFNNIALIKEDIRFAYRYYYRRLTLSDLNDKLSKYLGTEFSVVEVEDPYIENDVDTVGDKEILEDDD